MFLKQNSIIIIIILTRKNIMYDYVKYYVVCKKIADSKLIFNFYSCLSFLQNDLGATKPQ